MRGRRGLRERKFKNRTLKCEGCGTRPKQIPHQRAPKAGDRVPGAAGRLDDKLGAKAMERSLPPSLKLQRAGAGSAAAKANGNFSWQKTMG